jgi:hypothetical protein
MRKHSGAVLLCVFVEHDSFLTAPQQPRERLATGEEWLLAQIGAIMLKEIESVEKGDSGALDAAQLVKTGRIRDCGASEPARLGTPPSPRAAGGICP